MQRVLENASGSVLRWWHKLHYTGFWRIVPCPTGRRGPRSKTGCRPLEVDSALLHDLCKLRITLHCHHQCTFSLLKVSRPRKPGVGRWIQRRFKGSAIDATIGHCCLCDKCGMPVVGKTRQQAEGRTYPQATPTAARNYRT